MSWALLLLVSMRVVAVNRSSGLDETAATVFLHVKKSSSTSHSVPSLPWFSYDTHTYTHTHTLSQKHKSHTPIPHTVPTQVEMVNSNLVLFVSG